jgi:hypothetical protein
LTAPEAWWSRSLGIIQQRQCDGPKVTAGDSRYGRSTNGGVVRRRQGPRLGGGCRRIGGLRASRRRAQGFAQFLQWPPCDRGRRTALRCWSVIRRALWQSAHAVHRAFSEPPTAPMISSRCLPRRRAPKRSGIMAVSHAGSRTHLSRALALTVSVLTGSWSDRP